MNWKANIFLAAIFLLLISGCATLNTSGTEETGLGVTATAGDEQVTISWNIVSDADSYNIYSASESGVTKSNYLSLPDGLKQSATGTSETRTGLTNGTTYYFVVTSVNSSGESEASSQVSATPLVNITGTWVAIFNGTLFQEDDGPDHTTTMMRIITQSGTILSGTESFTDTKNRSGSWPLSGSVNGNNVTFDSSTSTPETGVVSGETMVVTGDSGSGSTYTWTFTKQ